MPRALPHQAAADMFDVYQRTGSLEQALDLFSSNPTVGYETTLRHFVEHMNEPQLFALLDQQANTLDQHALIASLIFKQVSHLHHSNWDLVEQSFHHAYKYTTANVKFVEDALFFWSTTSETFPLMVHYLREGDQRFQKECQKKLAHRVCNLQCAHEHLMFKVAPYLSDFNSRDLFNIWHRPYRDVAGDYLDNVKNIAQALASDETYTENRIGLAQCILQHICDLKPCWSSAETQLLHDTIDHANSIATKHVLNTQLLQHNTTPAVSLRKM